MGKPVMGTQVDLIYGRELGREQGSEADDPWFYMPRFGGDALRPNSSGHSFFATMNGPDL